MFKTRNRSRIVKLNREGGGDVQNERYGSGVVRSISGDAALRKGGRQKFDEGRKTERVREAGL
jgi:hypothetical protein